MSLKFFLPTLKGKLFSFLEIVVSDLKSYPKRRHGGVGKHPSKSDYFEGCNQLSDAII